MKINKRILREAIAFHHRSLLPDLLYTKTVRAFQDGSMTPQEYMNAEKGFNRFLYDYGVGRTIAAGEEKKLMLLEELKEYEFDLKHIPQTIEAFASHIQARELSSNSNGRKSKPLSFTSKLMFIMYPDIVMPYDSFARNSLCVYAGKPVKSLEDYYRHAGEFRNAIYKVMEGDLNGLHKGMGKEEKRHCKELDLKPTEHIVWRITDKYLWVMDDQRRKKK